MKERRKYWWWRVWTFRKEKFKLILLTDRTILLGESFINSDRGYILYIGKGYFIPTRNGIINVK